MTGLQHLILLKSIYLCCTLWSNPISAQLFTFKGKQQKDRISFDIVKNIVIIPVLIGGKGPFDFILDTGVSTTLITDTEIIKQLDLKNWRPVNLYGYSKDKEIEAKMSSTIDAQIGNAYCTNMNTIAIESDPFNLSAYLGRKISGIIGYSFFGGFAVKVNYDNNRLSFSSRKDKVFKGKKIPIEIIGYKPYMNASIATDETGPQSVKLLIDCGASHALALEKLHENPWPSSKKVIDGNLGVGLSGEINGKIGRIERLNIAGFTFKQVLTNFPKYDSFLDSVFLKTRNGNLGAEILKRFNITYDYPNQAIYLRKSHLFEKKFEHDMSGIEFYLDQGACFISRIEPYSSAEAVGFLPGDRIIGINFKDISDYKVDQITEILKSNDGYTVVIEVLRNNKTIIKLLKLKRRI